MKRSSPLADGRALHLLETFIEHYRTMLVPAPNAKEALRLISSTFPAPLRCGCEISFLRSKSHLLLPQAKERALSTLRKLLLRRLSVYDYISAEEIYREVSQWVSLAPEDITVTSGSDRATFTAEGELLSGLLLGLGEGTSIIMTSSWGGEVIDVTLLLLRLPHRVMDERRPYRARVAGVPISFSDATYWQGVITGWLWGSRKPTWEDLHLVTETGCIPLSW